jgi:hypothetical protein
MIRDTQQVLFTYQNHRWTLTMICPVGKIEDSGSVRIRGRSVLPGIESLCGSRFVRKSGG